MITLPFKNINGFQMGPYLFVQYGNIFQIFVMIIKGLG